MGLKDALRKAAGLLVELPPEQAETEPPADGSSVDQLFAELEKDAPPAPAKTVEQILQESQGPNLDEVKVPPSATPAGAPPEGNVDFQAIYSQANLPVATFSAEQMLEMLASLPQELPLETKRQTVKVSLNALGKTMGATPDSIVADATRKLAALNSYIENLNRQTSEFVAGAEGEIAALQAQIDERRKAIQNAKVVLIQASQRCDAEADRVDDILEFFSLDVPPSTYAPTPNA